MSHHMVEILKKQLGEQTDAELLKIWTENDREMWSPEAFEAIGQILSQRGVTLPSQRSSAAQVPSGPPQSLNYAAPERTTLRQELKEWVAAYAWAWLVAAVVMAGILILTLVMR